MEGQFQEKDQDLEGHMDHMGQFQENGQIWRTNCWRKAKDLAGHMCQCKEKDQFLKGHMDHMGQLLDKGQDFKIHMDFEKDQCKEKDHDFEDHIDQCQEKDHDLKGHMLQCQ